MTTLAKTFGYSDKVVPGRSGTPHSYQPSLVVGFELEVENARVRHPAPGVWIPQTDGSLRNNGLEFITPPLAGKGIDDSINEMWDKMPDGWSFSQRTSVHVHVNARDLTWQQLKMWLLTYCVVEEVMFDFASPDRAKGIFCVPLLDTSYPDYLISKLVTNTHRAQQGWEKYSAVNLSRLGDLGTVEFRHMPGTRDKEKILLWVKMLDDLRAAGISFTEEGFLQLLEVNNPRVMLRRIFCDRVLNVLSTKRIEEICRNGMDVVRCALAGEELRVHYLNNMATQSKFNMWSLKGPK